MSTQIKEFIDIPQQFVRDGNQVSSWTLSPRQSKRNGMLNVGSVLLTGTPHLVLGTMHKAITKRYLFILASPPWGNVFSRWHALAEYIQISKAVAIGFAIMGFIGYFVKLIHIPMYVFATFLAWWLDIDPSCEQ
jgi:preprotein translocase subunit Sss1